jgi:hypothetical protein
LGDHGAPLGLDRVVAVCVDLLEVDGAGISVIGDGEHRGAVALSAARYGAVDELQFSLGEGPCIDADTQGGPVLEPELVGTEAQWPAWAPAAMVEGVRAVFAFPLRVGAARLGALSAYRATPGELTPIQLGDALVLANVATHLLLDLEAETSPRAVPGRLAETVEARAVVHQATGMIAVQLDVRVTEALSALRAHAWAHSRSLNAVATDVVARRLRLQ